MKVWATSVSTKGQVVIPCEIRKRLGLGPGARLVVATDGESVLLRPVLPPRMEEIKKLSGKSRQAIAGLDAKALVKAVGKIRRARIFS